MCGFVGFSDTNTAYDRRAVTNAMCEKIAHRGPDSRGSFHSGAVSLGFCRLSLVDLEGGDQPMQSADGRYVIVMNGEIYNYRELREKLIRENSCTFRTQSDTEVVLQAYRVYGEKTVELLRGMFAFVILDKQDGSLFGARDPFGIKPFYYTQQGSAFLFASELKAFWEHPSFHAEISPVALKMYLVFQYVPLRETICKDVFRLEQGRYFTYRGGEMNIVRYFDPMMQEAKWKSDDAAERIDRAFQDSVRCHQIADVEIGAFLSAGVDSGYVLSLARPDRVYSIGFEQDGFDETEQAQALCRALELKTQVRTLRADEFFAALPEIQYYMDEPEANLSSVPLYFLAQAASKDVKAVLSGEGADELFGGYQWYIQSDASLLWRKLPKSVRRKFAAWTKKAPDHVRRFFAENAKDVEETFIGQAFIMDDETANSLLRENYRCDITCRDVTKPFYDRVKGCDDLTKKLYLDMNLWLPNEILLKADRMTMAHSLELRVPYLDRELWAIAKTLPSRLKMRRRLTKPALRKAAARHIPADTANREKAGFLVPFRFWLREEPYYQRVRDVLRADYAAEFFDTERLLTMLDAHRDGRENNCRSLYTVYSFLLWYREYFLKEHAYEDDEKLPEEGIK